ncbi:MAG: sensor histidine kinase [Verrucomicrobiota bacterium]
MRLRAGTAIPADTYWAVPPAQFLSFCCRWLLCGLVISWPVSLAASSAFLHSSGPEVTIESVESPARQRHGRSEEPPKPVRLDGTAANGRSAAARMAWRQQWAALLFQGLAIVSLSLGPAMAVWLIQRRGFRRQQARLLELAQAEAALAEEHRQRLQAEKKVHALTQHLIAAHETERSRVARELHDDVTQRLALLAIDAAQAHRRAETRTTAEAARAIHTGLVQLSQDVHDLAYRLHPLILDDLGLEDALRTECSQFTKQTGVPAEVRASDLPSPMRGDAALGLFRIAQEALRNTARHARAAFVLVSLGRVDGGVQLAIRDDGVGFDPVHHVEHHCLGQASMRERAELLGGELEIESAPGHGTTVIAWVPLRERRPG